MRESASRTRKAILFVGALVDKETRRLDVEHGEHGEHGRIVAEEALFTELDRCIRDVRVHDGHLYIVEDGRDADIVRVIPTTE